METSQLLGKLPHVEIQAKAVLRALLAAFLMIAAHAGSVRGGPIEDGEAMLGAGDYANAFSLFMELAGSRDPRALFYVGLMYQRGEGVARDVNVAAKWFRRSADQGDDVAQFSLARMYQSGVGVPHAYTEALKWYGASAGQGNADAAYNIGLMYERGEGVIQDHVAARWWIQKAADLRSADAMAALAVLDGKTPGTLPDYTSTPLRYGAPRIPPAEETASLPSTAPEVKPPPIQWDIGPAGATLRAGQGNAPAGPPAVREMDTSRAALLVAAPTPDDVVDSIAKAAWESNPTVMAWRALQLAIVNRGEKLNADALDAMIGASGLQGFYLRAGKYSREAVAMLIELERQEQLAAALDARTEYSWPGTPVRALTRVAVKLGDPLHLAVVLLLFRLLRRSRKVRTSGAS
ncbi:MAG: sel1 repeat family protein [Betaproteobacteria bacterium]|nr:sel1 repeat family protein [Betaproteobacteria bacterium]